jgi:hypothetical protein
MSPFSNDSHGSADARTDVYFDKAGHSLAARLLQAAALDDRPITDAYVWSTREEDDEAAVILEEHGLTVAAASARSVLDAPRGSAAASTPPRPSCSRPCATPTCSP